MSRLSRIEYLASWCIGIGIVLLILGARGTGFVPMTTEEEQAEARIRQRIVENRQPPYLDLGRWGIGVGIGLVCVGGILWVRGRPSGSRWVRSNEDV